MPFREEPENEDIQRILVAGRPDYQKCDNMITTSKYTVITFFPIAIREQFRRVANMYFLVVGFIMAFGYYTTWYDSAVSPWTTLGPLAIVIGVSLLQEGYADHSRHKSDEKTNLHPCVVLRRADEVDQDHAQDMNKRRKKTIRTRDTTIRKGQDVTVSLKKAYFLSSTSHQTAPTPIATSGTESDAVKIAYESVLRKDIRAGDIVLVRNREMVPADVVLLASSNDKGSAYIETSSIDGETNLKLRNSPHLPKEVVEIIRREKGFEAAMGDGTDEESQEYETLEQATKRITRMSALAYPHGQSVLENPENRQPEHMGEEVGAPTSLLRRFSHRGGSFMRRFSTGIGDGVKGLAVHTEVPLASDEFQPDVEVEGETKYVSALTSETPNASVNTYSGKLTLPPVVYGGPGIDIALNADNVLLRGAVLRNTEWAIGLACFTGTDTKLVQNSIENPPKFSQLDMLMNKTVFVILGVMGLCIVFLSSMSVYSTNKYFDQLWYLGLNKDSSVPWPYLPPGTPPPDWKTSGDNWIQKFLLFITLLTNFIPLSLYVTIEIITVVLKVYINMDLDMYHEGTDTRAVARSTTVTDLGQVQYVFSDKTGTLTQNVMRFKRCSVDGLAFGAPVEKARPGEEGEEPKSTAAFHPLRHLLVGQVDYTSRPRPFRQASEGLEELGQEGTIDDKELKTGGTLTFNAEFFLRVMSLCHTVVVEKDLDAMDTLNGNARSRAGTESSGVLSSLAATLFGRKASSMEADRSLGAISELEEVVTDSKKGDYSSSSRSKVSGMGADGAPAGFAYQAESPDEGALVQAASCTFGFQVIGRDSSGITLSCSSQTLLQDEKIRNGLKRGNLTPQILAGETSKFSRPSSSDSNHDAENEPRIETWSVLAVNKFDSERKRMSILVRSPPELGSIPMLLCKGADSSMLDGNVCVGAGIIMSGKEEEDDIEKKSLELDIPRPDHTGRWDDDRDVSHLTTVSEDTEDKGGENLESTALLGIQAHLGDFASEGLRTLVLGVRILTEEECSQWLEKHSAAATSIKNREDKLKEVAFEIERDLHIVGATAIEDKLQRGVPETIANLERAGIKLWVLTGDKRETAVEIGYSTHVLTPKMHVTEVAAVSADHVRTLMAMEFMRLVKMGKLTKYQRSALGKEEGGVTFEDVRFTLGKQRRSFSRTLRRLYHKYIKVALCFLCLDKYGDKDPAVQKIAEEEKEDQNLLKTTERRRNVRDRAEKIIQEYLMSPEAKERKRHTESDDGFDDELSLTSDDRPLVFTRAQSARAMMDRRRSHGSMTSTELRSLSLAQLTAQQVLEGPLVAEDDILSVNSFFPGEDKSIGYFDRRKRTLLERVFAVDHAVRHGTLVKHLKREKLSAIAEEEHLGPAPVDDLETDKKADALEIPRALVIEGAALNHLLGDSELEELLFAVASCSESVIACRVSPKQKALLVRLVRKNVNPEPVTLAIGDGANDVGMIQEAHVGIGISGKEGQQAVNASDFAIAQFRFLEELLLIHGRWNFYRQSTTVLFSFYKNAVMAGCLIVFSGETLYSGQPLFDEWIIAMLNFVATAPIFALGWFDRCLEKDYIRKHPEVYGPGRKNELMTLRILFRWIILALVHIFILYNLTVRPLTGGGGVTSAWSGMMRRVDGDAPGDGEGGDLKSVGTVTFTCLIFMLAYKVLYESRTILHGRWPAIRCCKKGIESFWNRLAYHWIGVFWFSLVFYIWAIYIYSLLGRLGPGSFSQFVDTAMHVLHTRSLSWMLIVFVPVACMAADVIGKVYGNLFFPTQAQIHLERQAKQIAEARRNERKGSHRSPTIVNHMVGGTAA